MFYCSSRRKLVMAQKTILFNIRKHRSVRGIPSLKKINVGLWKNCQIGKMRKTSFKSKNYQSEEVLEIVHTDLCGPIGIESYSGEKFFILFVDDCSRMMVVIYLKENQKLLKNPNGISKE